MYSAPEAGVRRILQALHEMRLAARGLGRAGVGYSVGTYFQWSDLAMERCHAVRPPAPGDGVKTTVTLVPLGAALPYHIHTPASVTRS